jgi:hypothetical protein
MRILTFNRPPCSHFWILAKVALFKFVHTLKICQRTKFYGSTLTGASFAQTNTDRMVMSLAYIFPGKKIGYKLGSLYEATFLCVCISPYQPFNQLVGFYVIL